MGNSTPDDNSSDWRLGPNLQIVNTEDTGSLFSFEIQFNNPPPVNFIIIHIDYDPQALSINNKAALETATYNFGTPVQVIVDEDRGHIEGVFQSSNAMIVTFCRKGTINFNIGTVDLYKSQSM